MNFIKKFVRIFFGMVFSILGAVGWLLQCLLETVTILFIVCLIGGTVVFIKVKPYLEQSRQVAYDTLAQMKRDDFSMLSDTEIFDKNGKRIGLINAGHYEYVDISDISLNLQNAYIAQEDRRFKTHSGVDWIATARAGLALVKHRGAITQGGSTITQQIIKNTYLTQEQTFTRKMVEILLAPEIEKVYSKADIMEFYCNTNFYGHQCYGVQAASRYYFGKDAADLEVHEAAVLVGISNSPSAYDPITHPEAALKKRNEVLKSMVEVDMLSQEEYEKASSHSLRIIQEQQEGTDDSYLTSYAIHCASLELMKQEEFPFQYTFKDKEDYESYMEHYTAVYNEKNDSIRNGGYRIYTALDQDIQAMAQARLDEVLSSFTELQDNGKFALQGAAAIVDNQTNYIVAVVGGRGTEDQFNRAYLSARQPGSTIKPLIDYGPAFDTGEYYPSRIIDDHKWEDGPSNSGGGYHGPVTVREALNRSLNTVAWQVLEDIGIDTGLSYLDNMQFHRLTYVDNGVASLSIGGFTTGVRVVDMAKGFSTLANGGIYNDSTCIVRIEHEREGVLTSRIPPITRQVYGSDTAYMLTDILKGTMTAPYGTGRGLGLKGGMPAAGKTGTTNSSKDTWFCGYTRYYTGAVWVGYDTPRAMPGIFGSTYAGVIWKNVMNDLHEELEPWDWERPETVVKDTYDSVTGQRLHPTLTCITREEAESRGIMNTVIAEPEILASQEAVYTRASLKAQKGVYFMHKAAGPGIHIQAEDSDLDGPHKNHPIPDYDPRQPGGPGMVAPEDRPKPPEPEIPVGPGIEPPDNSQSVEASAEPVLPPPELPQEPVPIPAPAVTRLEGGLYIEPEVTAGTNLTDYFSTSSQLRAQQTLADKSQQRLINELNELVTAFEKETIDSAADVEEIRSKHQVISEKLNQLESGDVRKELFDRTETRWQEFVHIIDTMSESIRVYEEKQALLKQQERRKADQQAEINRKNQEIQDRITAFETVLGMLEAMNYRSSDTDTLITTAIAKLGELYGYTDTTAYQTRLENAIRRVRTLPSESQWNSYEAQEKSNALTQGARQQQDLYRLYQTERYYWSDIPSYGPGRNEP
ncbi:MAG: hypothetical protein HFG70_00935 [Hungatella sp.]|nr:hypothetical protein [Hungatella sp.]